MKLSLPEPKLIVSEWVGATKLVDSNAPFPLRLRFDPLVVSAAVTAPDGRLKTTSAAVPLFVIGSSPA